MKQELAIFLLIIIMISFSQQQTPATNILKGLEGFKCSDQTNIEFPIRLAASGKIECFSLDGKFCAKAPSSGPACKSFIQKNISKVQPITCGKSFKENTGLTLFDEKNHWCKRAYHYFFVKWHCEPETGISTAIRLNKKTFNVECISKNGKDCLWGELGNKVCEKVNTCKKFRAKVEGLAMIMTNEKLKESEELNNTALKNQVERSSNEKALNFKLQTLSCGPKHEKIWGHNGYFFPHEHWCKKGYAFFRYTGNFSCKEQTNMNVPVRLDANGFIQCLSRDGKFCVNDADTDEKCQALVVQATDNGRIEPNTISCGDQLKRLSGVTGFENKNHWCRKAFEKLYKPNNPEKIKKAREIKRKIRQIYKSNGGVIPKKIMDKIKASKPKISHTKPRILTMKAFVKTSFVKRIRNIIKTKGANNPIAIKLIKKILREKKIKNPNRLLAIIKSNPKNLNKFLRNLRKQYKVKSRKIFKKFVPITKRPWFNKIKELIKQINKKPEAMKKIKSILKKNKVKNSNKIVSIIKKNPNNINKIIKSIKRQVRPRKVNRLPKTVRVWIKKIKKLIKKNLHKTPQGLRLIKSILKKNNVKNPKKLLKIIKKNPNNIKKIIKSIKRQVRPRKVNRLPKKVRVWIKKINKIIKKNLHKTPQGLKLIKSILKKNNVKNPKKLLKIIKNNPLSKILKKIKNHVKLSQKKIIKIAVRPKIKNLIKSNWIRKIKDLIKKGIHKTRSGIKLIKSILKTNKIRNHRGIIRQIRRIKKEKFNFIKLVKKIQKQLPKKYKIISLKKLKKFTEAIKKHNKSQKKILRKKVQAIRKILSGNIPRTKAKWIHIKKFMINNKIKGNAKFWIKIYKLFINKKPIRKIVKIIKKNIKKSLNFKKDPVKKINKIKRQIKKLTPSKVKMIKNIKKLIKTIKRNKDGWNKLKNNLMKNKIKGTKNFWNNLRKKFLTGKPIKNLMKSIKNNISIRYFLISKRGIKRFFLKSLANIAESKKKRTKEGLKNLRYYLSSNNIKLTPKKEKKLEKKYLGGKRIKSIKNDIKKEITKRFELVTIRGKDNRDRRIALFTGKEESKKGIIKTKKIDDVKSKKTIKSAEFRAEKSKRYILISDETRREFLINLRANKDKIRYQLDSVSDSDIRKFALTSTELMKYKLDSDNRLFKLDSAEGRRRYILDSNYSERYQLDSEGKKRHKIDSEGSQGKKNYLLESKRGKDINKRYKLDSSKNKDMRYKLDSNRGNGRTYKLDSKKSVDKKYHLDTNTNKRYKLDSMKGKYGNKKYKLDSMKGKNGDKKYKLDSMKGQNGDKKYKLDSMKGGKGDKRYKLDSQKNSIDRNRKTELNPKLKRKFKLDSMKNDDKKRTSLDSDFDKIYSLNTVKINNRRYILRTGTDGSTKRYLLTSLPSKNKTIKRYMLKTQSGKKYFLSSGKDNGKRYLLLSDGQGMNKRYYLKSFKDGQKKFVSEEKLNKN